MFLGIVINTFVSYNGTSSHDIQISNMLPSNVGFIWRNIHNVNLVVFIVCTLC